MASFTSIRAGDYNNTVSTTNPWGVTGSPGLTDTVTIGHAVTSAVSLTRQATTTINTGGSLAITGDVSFTSNLTVQTGASLTATGNITQGSTSSGSNTTITVNGTGTFTCVGTFTQGPSTCTCTIAAATATFSFASHVISGKAVFGTPSNTYTSIGDGNTYAWENNASWTRGDGTAAHPTLATDIVVVNGSDVINKAADLNVNPGGQISLAGGGTLNVTGAVTQTGGYIAEQSGTITLTGRLTITGGRSTFSVAKGTIYNNNGVLSSDVDCSHTAAAPTLENWNVSGGTWKWTGLTANTFTVPANVTIGAMLFPTSTSISFAGNCTISNAMTVISNSGAYPTVVAPGSTIVNYGTWSGTSGSMTFSGITFINYGTFTFASAITVSSPAIFRNFGTFAPSSNSFGCSGGNLTFYQDGIATLTGTCGFTMYFSKDTKIVLGASAFVSTANTNFAATRRGARLLDSSGNVLVSTDKAYGYKESA